MQRMGETMQMVNLLADICLLASNDIFSRALEALDLVLLGLWLVPSYGLTGIGYWMKA
jgi:hypothetical protein